MVEKWTIPYPAYTGEEPRRVYVYVPDSFDADNTLRYPVLYMFDGHNLFYDEDATYGKCWGLKEYMDFTETQLLIVGVECNRSPDNGRLSEYSPFTFQDARFGRVTGRGQETMEWFIHELKPVIDRQYPTLPDRRHTYIAGSSMGGLMSLYAVTQYNRVFSRAAALSPSLWCAPRRLDDLMRGARIQSGTVVYMDYGARELRNHRNMLGQFTAASRRLMQKQVLLTARIVPGGTHSEASWERQIPFFLNTLLYQQP